MVQVIRLDSKLHCQCSNPSFISKGSMAASALQALAVAQQQAQASAAAGMSLKTVDLHPLD